MAPQSPVLADFRARVDRKSTRLNSSHLVTSYAVFCLKKTKRGGLGRRAQVVGVQEEVEPVLGIEAARAAGGRGLLVCISARISREGPQCVTVGCSLQ